jgi:hypothetical protein
MGQEASLLEMEESVARNEGNLQGLETFSFDELGFELKDLHL